MKLNLYKKSGTLRVALSPEESSVQVQELQGGNYISVTASTTECVKLQVGDYADFLGTKYFVSAKYTPKMISSHNWQYSLQMYAIDSLINNFLVVKEVDKDNDVVFSYTANAELQLQLIVSCINTAFSSEVWKVGEVLATDNIVMEYNSTYCADALKQLATKANTEFWIEGTTINLSRCEHGEALELGYRQGLKSIEEDKANNVKFFTRLFPLGSKRNIVPADYGDVRLQLPNKAKYIEQDADKYGIIDHSEEQAFAHIYPKRIGVVSSVRSEERTNKENNPYKIYYFKDDAMPFNPNEHEIGGLVKQVSWQSGELDGRDFEVNYNHSTKEFEIITQYPYEDMQLPNDVLTPKIGDKYILWNIKMPDTYYREAEQELQRAVDKFLADNRKDISVYRCNTDYIYIRKNNISIMLGQRVKLVSDTLFEGGYINSRVTKITRKLNLSEDMVIEVGDVVDASPLTVMSDKINRVSVKTSKVVASMPNIVKSYETTLLTDTNVMSSKRVVKAIEENNEALGKEYLSKTQDDIVKGVVTFEKGLKSLNDIIGRLASLHNLSVSQVADIAKLVISGEIKSSDYSNTDGFKLFNTPAGWTMEIDHITARKTFKVLELVVERITHQGGQIIQSPAGGELIKKHSETSNYWGFYVSSQSDFRAGDLVVCQTFKSGVTKRYWRCVDSYSDDGTDKLIFIRKNDCEAGSSICEVGDQIAVLGNKNYVERQNARIINVIGANAPYVADYKGINDYSLQNKLINQIGNLAGVNDAVFGSLTGVGTYTNNFYGKGRFVVRSGEDIEIFVTGKASNAKEEAIKTAKQELETAKNNVERQIANSEQATKNEINGNISRTRQEVINEVNANISNAEARSNKDATDKATSAINKAVEQAQQVITETEQKVRREVKEEIKAGFKVTENGLLFLGQQFLFAGTVLARNMVLQEITANKADIGRIISDSITTKKIEVTKQGKVVALLDADKEVVRFGDGTQIGELLINNVGLRCLGKEYKIESDNAGRGRVAHLSTWFNEPAVWAQADDDTAIIALSKNHSWKQQANSTRVAIRGKGGVFFNTTPQDYWRMPGVLWCGRVNASGIVTQQWGDGISTIKVRRVYDGHYRVDFGSDAPIVYFPFVVADEPNWHGNAFVMSTNSDGFNYSTVDTSKGHRAMWSVIAIFGVPRMR